MYGTHTIVCEAIIFCGGIAMAEQALVQARVDKELKQEVAEIYEALGMDLPTAIRMFFVRSKMVRGIPFDTTLPKDVLTRTEAMNALDDMFEQASDVPEMSLDEINAEIAEVKADRKAAKRRKTQKE
jgi:DNA-damage-inducible protein J